MEIRDIEDNIFRYYGIDTATLYGNFSGREKMLVSTVRYIFWHILHEEYGYSGNRLTQEFNRCPRMIWRGLSLVKFRLQYDRYYSDIYNKLKGLV